MHERVIIEVENSINSSACAHVPVSAAREEVQLLLVVEARETDLGSKTIHRDLLIQIVVEQNVGNRCERLLVLVWLGWVDVVEGTWLFWVSVRASEVDARDC